MALLYFLSPDTEIDKPDFAVFYTVPCHLSGTFPLDLMNKYSSEYAVGKVDDGQIIWCGFVK
jgi:hypothetical protein